MKWRAIRPFYAENAFRTLPCYTLRGKTKVVCRTHGEAVYALSPAMSYLGSREVLQERSIVGTPYPIAEVHPRIT